MRMDQSTKGINCDGVAPIYFNENNLNRLTAIATAVIIAISSAFSVLTNTLIITVFIRKKMLNAPLNFLLVNMCAVDFFVGIVEQPVFVAIRALELKAACPCFLKQIGSFLGYVCGGISISIVGLISLDRWLAITMPFRYESIVTRKKISAILISSYVFCITGTLLYMNKTVRAKGFYLTVSLLLFTVVILVLICFAKIYKITRDHERKINSFNSLVLEMKHSKEVSNQNMTPGSMRRTAWKGKLMHTFAQRRKSRTVIFMAIFLIFCYLPKVCVILDAYLAEEDSLPSYAALRWSETVFLLNSAINPIIYCIRMTCIRSEIFNLFEIIRFKMACQ